jgi:hypothetical protein
VHFANTLAVVDKLIESGKAVQVLPFPGRGTECLILRREFS